MTLRLNGTSSGFTEIDAPAAAGSNKITLPTSNGSAEQFLKNSGTAGELEFSSMVETSTGIGIGTTTPSRNLTVSNGTNAIIAVQNSGQSTEGVFNAPGGGTINLGTTGSYGLTLSTNNTERARLDSSGRLLVGTTSSSTTDTLVLTGHSSSSTANAIIRLRRGSLPTSGQGAGTITFEGSDAGVGAQISAFADGSAWASNDYPTRLVFSTTADGASSPTERMRITHEGYMRFGQTTSDSPGYGNTTTGISMLSDGRIFSSMGGTFSQFNRNSNGAVINFARSSTGVGVISVTTSSTSYGTSSDYRLKENVVDLADGITRVKQLQPRRFNFIVDADTTVDGFLAHEAQTVVPEAVTGTHDEVDDNSNPVYQCIDQSKLVPLLTAALKEAISKIETLETQNTAQQTQIDDLLARVTALEAA